jgi:hypothetical protein
LNRKITFGEMREMGVLGLLVYCSDYLATLYRAEAAAALCRDEWHVARTGQIKTGPCQRLSPPHLIRRPKKRPQRWGARLRPLLGRVGLCTRADDNSNQ